MVLFELNWIIETKFSFLARWWWENLWYPGDSFKKESDDNKLWKEKKLGRDSDTL